MEAASNASLQYDLGPTHIVAGDEDMRHRQVGVDHGGMNERPARLGRDPEGVRGMLLGPLEPPVPRFEKRERAENVDVPRRVQVPLLEELFESDARAAATSPWYHVAHALEADAIT